MSFISDTVARRNRAHFTSKREIFTPSASSKSTEVKHFPSLLISDDDIKLTSFRTTKPQVYLTVVVPAMNEEDRLPLMLDECLEYLEKRKKAESTFTYEVSKQLSVRMYNPKRKIYDTVDPQVLDTRKILIRHLSYLNFDIF
uniref:Glycosyltransferase 2-like domain-containing protein n=1 Tax=Ditylenchus dipsaci TaxID=166011 RepID=A0A915ELZ9_9BILA